jgi:tetratricopeptide (TPR) repeat protein
MDSRASFAAAAKHLFRHLHDAGALRKNPLVRGYFASGEGGTSKGRDAAALARIHDGVRRGAEQCRDADLLDGRDERAFRQYSIVTLQCLERHPMREVAATLGISYAHCYRERAAICRRVARYIAERDEAPVFEQLPAIDEFRFLANQVLHRAELGDAAAVLQQCDELVRDAPSVQEKIEALRVSATVSVHFGRFDRAKAVRATAQALWTKHFDKESSSAGAIAGACIDLMSLDLAMHGDVSNLLRAAKSATRQLEPFVARGPMRIRELHVESLFNLGLTLANLGNLEKGFDHFAQAEALLERVRPASAQLRSWAMVETWRGRNRLLMSSRHWLPAWQREQGLMRAFEYGYSSGAFTGAVRALVALTEHHAFAGNDDEALRAACAAVSLAKRHPSAQVSAHTSISAALPLLSTQHWARGAALLPLAAQLDAMDTYHRDAFRYCVAMRALRSQAFGEALHLADGSSSFPGVAVRMRLVAAAAAHALEREREARRLIEEGVAVAEAQRSAPILRDAYSLASQIVPSARFKGQAREIERLLTA